MRPTHNQANQVGAPHAPGATLGLSDLDREELLFLIHRRFGLALLTERDLWLARWETLSDRETAARAKSDAADQAWTDAIGRLVEAPRSNRAEGLVRSSEARRLDRTRRSLNRHTARAQAAADAAYARLIACD